MSTKFNLISDNKFWNILKQTNDLHVTSRQLYLQLMGELKSSGVAFKDIKRYLMNQAKKSGLYRKDYWDAKTKEMIYRPINKGLKDVSWYRSMVNFLNWLRDNYSDYGVEKERKAKSSPLKNKSFTIVRKKNGEVVSETTITGGSKDDLVKSNTDSSTSGGSSNGGERSTGATATGSSQSSTPASSVGTGSGNGDASDSNSGGNSNSDSIIKPVAEELGLSKIQIQQIVLQNLEVISSLAKSCNCEEEYEAFASKMNEALGSQFF